MFDPNLDTGGVMLSRQCRHDNAAAPTAQAEQLQADLEELTACARFILPAIYNAVHLAKHRGVHNKYFDDFLNLAKDHYSDEIGSIENRLSDPFNEEIWGGR